MDEHLDRAQAHIAYSSSGPTGARHTVVVAHALATSRRWEDESQVFDWAPVAAAGGRLVRFDTRGHGESGGTADPEQYRWPSLADDLVAVADAVSPDRPIAALGENTGCGVLLWAALAAPHRFRRLLLVLPPTSGEARAREAELYRAAADLIELRGVDAWQRLLATAGTPPILQENGWVRPAWIPVREALLPSVMRGAAGSDFPDAAALRSIRQPTLVLAWRADTSHPISAAEHLAEHLPNCTLEVASSAGDVRAWGRRAAAFLLDDAPVSGPAGGA